MSLAIATRQIIALALLFLLAACTTIIPERAKIDYKKGYDFERIETVAFVAHDGDACFAADISLDEARRIDGILALSVSKRGLTVLDDPAQADALIDWHLVTEAKQDVRSYNAQSYYQCWRCGPSISDVSVTPYTMGTLIVDFIDPELSKSVWRGSMKGRVPDRDHPAEREARFTEAADKIFSRYPPGFLPF